MILYEFKCNHCSAVETRWQHPNDAKIEFTCRKCRVGVMSKVITAPAIHLDDSFPGQRIKKGG